MTSLKSTLSEEVIKIMKCPSRSGFKIRRTDAMRIIDSLKDMDEHRLISLREYLSVIPSFTKKRVEFRESNGELSACNIVCDESKDIVLRRAYGNDYKIKY